MVFKHQAELKEAISIIDRMQRRDFLKFSSAAIAATAAVGIAGNAYATTLKSVNVSETKIFLRVAQVVLPVEGTTLAPWNPDVLLQTLDGALLGTMEPHILAGLKGGLGYFNEGPKGKFGQNFVDLDTPKATQFLDEWGNSNEIPHRALAMGLKKLVQLSYWANPASWEPLGYDGPISKRQGLKSLGNAPFPIK